MMVFTNKYVYEDGFELNFFFSLNKKEREKGEGRREKGYCGWSRDSHAVSDYTSCWFKVVNKQSIGHK